jgi:hypothetical protein
MSKKKKLVKDALKRPELYSAEELTYFQMWLKARKLRKEKEKTERRLNLEKMLLL